MAQAEGLEGIFPPTPLPNLPTQQIMTELKQMLIALRKSQFSQSLQHQLFPQAPCEVFSASTRGRDASKVIEGFGGEERPRAGGGSGKSRPGCGLLMGECRKQNWDILSAGTGREAQMKV